LICSENWAFWARNCGENGPIPTLASTTLLYCSELGLTRQFLIWQRKREPENRRANRLK